MSIRIAYIIIGVLLMAACSEPDETPPVIVLKGNANVRSPLNTEWVDPGVEATDDFDGNITSSVFIESDININLAGFYTVTYSSADQAGNMAAPVNRTVEIYNSAENHTGNYDATDISLYPGQDSAVYTMEIMTDSTVNNRLLLGMFGNDPGIILYGDVSDTVFVIPYQFVGDTSNSFSIQGSGSINDTLIQVGYRQDIYKATILGELKLKKQS